MLFYSLKYNKSIDSNILNNRKKLFINLLENIINIKVPLDKKIIPLIEIMKHLNNKEIEPFLFLIIKSEELEEDLYTFLLLKEFCNSRGINSYS